MKPIDWIKAAEIDLKSAKTLGVGTDLSAPIAFHSQQAAEKAIKALILKKFHKISKTHDLMKLAKEAEITNDEIISQLKYLNRFYQPTRYPDAIAGSLETGLPTKQEADMALQNAKGIVGFIRKQIA
ncbi:HEPN domain-containing protein [Candidatus Collierbacteria bacterium]|nr:HEPN domain-containing protein [Candidatus Collierbacteria bacterium]